MRKTLVSIAVASAALIAAAPASAQPGYYGGYGQHWGFGQQGDR